jgi:23S rRNA (pseudouridine1915-N3)-methyltransferase
LRLCLVAVGKIKEPGLRAAIDEYFERVRRHYSIDEIELRDGPAPQQIAAFAKHVPPAAHVVGLDAAGTAKTSEDFARWLGQKLGQGKGSVAFLLGGAEGLPAPVLDLRGPPAQGFRATEILSLSKMTFSHRLARLVLAEQLYRATTILHNEPYARL